ncbi:MAG TPA: holo-ACP synthase [Anaerolineales bacterium]|nr:holo-ACP synthase [Anaerolineales bacterium]
MKLVTGVDMVRVARVQEAIERHGVRFLNRIFTQIEQRDSKGRFESLAARFAAKEAAAKALGCGIGKVSWLEIEVCVDGNRAPYLVFSGEGENLARQMGLTTWSVSLSHTESDAIAFVVGLG